MNTFVYKITNRVNGKIYIGKSIDVATRWYQHCWDAKHSRKQFPFLRAIRKYGPGSFRVQVLRCYASDAAAGREESRLIRQEDRRRCYNVAPGGTGGRTLSESQLASQYAIARSKVDEFKRLFAEGWSATRMAKHFGAGPSSVNRLATHLGLSFRARQLAGATRRRMTPRPGCRSAVRVENQEFREFLLKERGSVTTELMRSVVEVMIDIFLYRPPKYTPEERRRVHSETGRRVMAARARSAETLKAIAQAYFEQDLTAQQVGDRFGFPKSTIRGIINRAYAAMPADRLNHWKQRHGRTVRTGERNANYGKRKAADA